LASDDDMKTGGTRWLKSQGTEFYEAQIKNQSHDWTNASMLKNKVESIDNTI
jgi:hypothetical protein